MDEKTIIHIYQQEEFGYCVTADGSL